MSHDPTVLMSQCGGLYEVGRSYTKARWMELARRYEDEVAMNGICSVHRLAAIASTSLNSAAKAITYHQSGLIILVLKQGHQWNGAGALCRWEAIHDIMIWGLYLENPSRPLTGYAEELERMSGLAVSTITICRWFQTIGPFRCTMREMSAFPCRRDSWSTYHHLCQYLDFIRSIDNYRQLVFADKTPMKEVMIYSKVLRSYMMGQTPHHRMEAN